MNYERFVQWTSGPTSVVAGWIATKLVTHTSFLGQAGLGRNQVAHAVVVAVTFGVASVVTYAGHHKWLENVSASLARFPLAKPIPVIDPTVASEKLRAQLRNAGLTPEA